MSIDHVTFSYRAMLISANANRWASSALEGTRSLDRPVSDDELAIFIAEQRDALDRMWCYGVQGEARPPKDGEPGSSLTNTRNSELWPGFYMGKCKCGAYFMAAKRVTICDPCELAGRAAFEARRADLAERLKGAAHPPLASPSRTEVGR